MVIGLVVSSTETTACTLTPSAADLLVVISANKVAVWDSTVCKTSLLTAPVAISPGWATLAQASWSGRGSGSKCSTKEGFATPGQVHDSGRHARRRTGQDHIHAQSGAQAQADRNADTQDDDQASGRVRPGRRVGGPARRSVRGCWTRPGGRGPRVRRGHAGRRHLRRSAGLPCWRRAASAANRSAR